MISGYCPPPCKLVSDTSKVVFGGIGIFVPDCSLRVIVPLDETVVVLGRPFVLRFRSTSFDAALQALKVLNRAF